MLSIFRLTPLFLTYLIRNHHGTNHHEHHQVIISKVYPLDLIRFMASHHISIIFLLAITSIIFSLSFYKRLDPRSLTFCSFIDDEKDAIAKPSYYNPFCFNLVVETNYPPHSKVINVVDNCYYFGLASEPTFYQVGILYQDYYYSVNHELRTSVVFTKAKLYHVVLEIADIIHFYP